MSEHESRRLPPWGGLPQPARDGRRYFRWATFDSLSTGNQSDFGYAGRRTSRALATYGRASTRVRTGALRQATLSSMLIAGAFPAPSPSSIFGVLGPFLPFFDDPEPSLPDPDAPVVELVPESAAFSTGVKPSSSASFSGFGLTESFDPVSVSVRRVRSDSPAPLPVSPGAGGAGSAYVFFFSFH